MCCLCLNSEPNKDMQVVMGGLSLDSEEPTAQTIRVEEAIVHENYRETPSAVYNDISIHVPLGPYTKMNCNNIFYFIFCFAHLFELCSGLLRLRSNDGVCATESQFVKAACLPDAQLPDGMECTISGWGATEGCKIMFTYQAYKAANDRTIHNHVTIETGCFVC